MPNVQNHFYQREKGKVTSSGSQPGQTRHGRGGEGKTPAGWAAEKKKGGDRPFGPAAMSREEKKKENPDIFYEKKNIRYTYKRTPGRNEKKGKRTNPMGYASADIGKFQWTVPIGEKKKKKKRNPSMSRLRKHGWRKGRKGEKISQKKKDPEDHFTIGRKN